MDEGQSFRPPYERMRLPESEGTTAVQRPLHHCCCSEPRNLLLLEMAAQLDEQWKHVKIILQETKAEVTGYSTRKHQDWFDEADKEIQELPEKKHSCRNRRHTKPDDQAAEAAYKTACTILHRCA